MSCYAVGIGGSGTRVIECLLHLCIAGLGPDELTIVLVDLDVANGNVTRLVDLVQTYEHVRQHARATNVPWMRTKITLLEPRPWNPLAGMATVPRLDGFFGLETLKNSRPDLAALMQCCYCGDELGQDLQGGFRAMPAIGASVFGATVGTGEPWTTLGRDLQQRAAARQSCRVVVCGSIFGGTGASGFPTVPRLLRQSVQGNDDMIAVGGALLLPYFGFPTPDPKAGEVFAQAEDFLVQAQSGLSYYADFIGSVGYDRIYVVGDECRSQYEPRPWGPGQDNPVHFVELLSATSALHFYGDAACRDRSRPVAVVARKARDRFEWEDVPLRPQALLGRSARTAFAFAQSIHPALEHVSQGGARQRIPWQISLLDREGIDIRHEDVRRALNSQLRLSRFHLAWLAELQGGRTSTPGEVVRHLFDDRACPLNREPSAWDESRFAELVFESTRRERSVDWVWRRLAGMHSGSFKRQSAGGLGVLQSALYEACA